MFLFPAENDPEVLIRTCVSCAVGPSVNTLNFFFFTFSELKISKFGNVNSLRAQLVFPSKPNFCNLFEFPAPKSTEKSISSTP
jgi:hypothetical protein